MFRGGKGVNCEGSVLFSGINPREGCRWVTVGKWWKLQEAEFGLKRWKGGCEGFTLFLFPSSVSLDFRSTVR